MKSVLSKYKMNQRAAEEIQQRKVGHSNKNTESYNKHQPQYIYGMHITSSIYVLSL